MEEGFSEPLASHGSWEYELASRQVRWSRALFRIHGVSPDEFEPTPDAIRELIHPDDREMYREIVEEAIQARAPFAYQHRVTRPDGSIGIVLVRGAFMDGGGVARLVGTTQDVTGRPGEEERLWHLANHDSLTGLFNRRRFMEELRREVAFARRSGQNGAALILDLDRFKDINDTLGHQAGDALLARIAKYLQDRLRRTDTLARLGGDEFAVVLPSCDAKQARRIANELLAAIHSRATVQIGGLERRIRASIGIAPFGPGHGEGADELMVEADLAMYRAKSAGGGMVEAFDEEMRAELAQRLSLEGELREALMRDELLVHYQPIVSLRDGATIGCEALARWNHPGRGLVGPDEFIPVAEQFGLIGELGELVLTAACREAASWRRRGAHATISVNVSPHQLVKGGMVRQVAAILQETGLPAPLLCLEVTETSLLDDTSPLIEALHAIKELGVHLAIDDFGGGASSLALLRVLPVDQIKIDRMFVSGIADHPDDRAIVAAVLSLAEELGMTVVAEGVETERQQGQLRELGCQYAQGFLYSRAVPADELTLDGYSSTVRPGVGDPSVIREFMRQIGIPARIGGE